jgi:HPt (histidine-containing phosphotransfer) domain-containing protein
MIAIVTIAITALALMALVWAVRMAHLRNARVTPDLEALRGALDRERLELRPADFDDALVDPEWLADLQRGLPEGLFETLVEQCLVDIRARMPRLRDALRAGSPAAANEVAHALAGMAGSYGFTLFERRMRDIMVATAVSDMQVAAAKAQCMESELDRSAELLRALLRAHAA